MPFSDFSADDLQSKFGVVIREVPDLHAGVTEVPLPPRLASVAEVFFPLAEQLGTEKAKSELMIAPVLVEVREWMAQRISFFSGVEFNVDKSKGLNGACDFLLSRSPIQLVVRAPAAVIVEVKNENVLAGYGQCGAEMVAARIFNERAKNEIDTVHGCVTTGTIWRFLTLSGDELTIDRKLYVIPERLTKVFGILIHAVGGPLP